MIEPASLPNVSVLRGLAQRSSREAYLPISSGRYDDGRRDFYDSKWKSIFWEQIEKFNNVVFDNGRKHRPAPMF